MSSSANKYDSIESLIFENGLKILGLHFYQEMDLMLIVLNNQQVLKYPISESERLQTATKEHLENYELIGKGYGVHWPDIDEDLSLKGFLKRELANTHGIAV